MVHANAVGLGGDEVFGKAANAGTYYADEQVQSCKYAKSRTNKYTLTELTCMPARVVLDRELGLRSAQHAPWIPRARGVWLGPCVALELVDSSYTVC
jgi:hypothetical protein